MTQEKKAGATPGQYDPAFQKEAVRMGGDERSGCRSDGPGTRDKRLQALRLEAPVEGKSGSTGTTVRPWTGAA